LSGSGGKVVFAHTVGTTCLGTAYTTANMVPNIIYDIVLAARVLRSSSRSSPGRPARRPEARRIGVGAADLDDAAAHPGERRPRPGRAPDRLRAGCPARRLPARALAGVGARMLIVFAPQVLLFTASPVVLYGSSRRTALRRAALAPLLSSLW